MRRQPRALGFGLCTVCPLSGYSTSDNGGAALPFPHLGLSVGWQVAHDETWRHQPYSIVVSVLLKRWTKNPPYLVRMQPRGSPGINSQDQPTCICLHRLHFYFAEAGLIWEIWPYILARAPPGFRSTIRNSQKTRWFGYVIETQHRSGILQVSYRFKKKSAG
jgi:hypothetical protein